MALSLWNDDFFYDPFQTIRRMKRDMDNLFGSLTTPSQSSELKKWTPSIDVKETDSSYIIHAELPGVQKEDIKVELQNGVLSISGEKKQEKKEDNEKWHRVERSYGCFQRRMTVPEGVTEDNITAKFDNGVLSVEFPKPLKSQKKSIPITTAGSQ